MSSRKGTPLWGNFGREGLEYEKARRQATDAWKSDLRQEIQQRERSVSYGNIQHSRSHTDASMFPRLDTPNRHSMPQLTNAQKASSVPYDADDLSSFSPQNPSHSYSTAQHRTPVMQSFVAPSPVSTSFDSVVHSELLQLKEQMRDFQYGLRSVQTEMQSVSIRDNERARSADRRVFSIVNEAMQSLIHRLDKLEDEQMTVRLKLNDMHSSDRASALLRQQSPHDTIVKTVPCDVCTRSLAMAQEVRSSFHELTSRINGCEQSLSVCSEHSNTLARKCENLNIELASLHGSMSGMLTNFRRREDEVDAVLREIDVKAHDHDLSINRQQATLISLQNQVQELQLQCADSSKRQKHFSHATTMQQEQVARVVDQLEAVVKAEIRARLAAEEKLKAAEEAASVQLKSLQRAYRDMMDEIGTVKSQTADSEVVHDVEATLQDVRVTMAQREAQASFFQEKSSNAFTALESQQLAQLQRMNDFERKMVERSSVDALAAKLEDLQNRLKDGASSDTERSASLGLVSARTQQLDAKIALFEQKLESVNNENQRLKNQISQQSQALAQVQSAQRQQQQQQETLAAQQGLQQQKLAESEERRQQQEASTAKQESAKPTVIARSPSPVAPLPVVDTEIERARVRDTERMHARIAELSKRCDDLTSASEDAELRLFTVQILNKCIADNLINNPFLHRASVYSTADGDYDASQDIATVGQLQMLELDVAKLHSEILVVAKAVDSKADWVLQTIMVALEDTLEAHSKKVAARDDRLREQLGARLEDLRKNGENNIYKVMEALEASLKQNDQNDQTVRAAVRELQDAQERLENNFESMLPRVAKTIQSAMQEEEIRLDDAVLRIDVIQDHATRRAEIEDEIARRREQARRRRAEMEEEEARRRAAAEAEAAAKAESEAAAAAAKAGAEPQSAATEPNNVVTSETPSSTEEATLEADSEVVRVAPQDSVAEQATHSLQPSALPRTYSSVSPHPNVTTFSRSISPLRSPSSTDRRRSLRASLEQIDREQQRQPVRDQRASRSSEYSSDFERENSDNDEDFWQEVPPPQSSS